MILKWGDRREDGEEGGRERDEREVKAYIDSK